MCDAMRRDVDVHPSRDALVQIADFMTIDAVLCAFHVKLVWTTSVSHPMAISRARVCGVCVLRLLPFFDSIDVSVLLQLYPCT